MVGSCALSGRDWGVDYFADMARSIAEEFDLHFSMTRIYSEIQPELVIERLAAGRVHAIDPAPPYDAEIARRSSRIVAVMGVEPFQRALDEGADLLPRVHRLPLSGCCRKEEIGVSELRSAAVYADKYPEYLIEILVIFLIIVDDGGLVHHLIEIEERCISKIIVPQLLASQIGIDLPRTLEP